MALSTDQLLERFRAERAWTHRLVASIPEDRFDWRPSPSAFSCGELVRHLVLAEKFWVKMVVEAAEGREWDPLGYEGRSRDRFQAFRGLNEASSRDAELGQTFRDCLALWAARQEVVEQTIARILDEANDVIVIHPIALLRGTPAEIFLGFISHEVHHRGQLSAYLKMMDVDQPPIYTGDE